MTRQKTRTWMKVVVFIQNFAGSGFSSEGKVSKNRKVEKDSDQNTTVFYEHASSNDKNTMQELYIKQDKNSLRWSATKVLKKRQMFLLHTPDPTSK